MASPTTTYTSGFPDIVWPGNLKQERSLQQNVLLQRARDYNILDREVCQTQAYIGLHPIQGWAPGDDTLNDRLVKLGGTGSCPEDGEFCNYFGIAGLDPQATGYVQTTGTWFGTDWISPTGVFGDPNNPGLPGLPGNPPPPPKNPLSPMEPWQKPGIDPDKNGGGDAAPKFPGDGDGFDGRDFFPPGEPVEPEWAVKNHMLYQNFISEALAFRINTLSSENILLQPLSYSELLPFFTRLIETWDEFPSARTKPSQMDRAALLDVLLPLVGRILQVTDLIGIQWAKGTIADDGTYITYQGTNQNFGPQGADPTKIGLIVSNFNIPEFDI
ncbi:MAG: hypothetical protein ACXABY_19075, partial [Candidatus Thorarchaeota archaeon]